MFSRFSPYIYLSWPKVQASKKSHRCNVDTFFQIDVELKHFRIWVDFQFWDFMNMSAGVCAWLMRELRTHQWKYKFLHWGCPGGYPTLIYSTCEYGSVCGNTLRNTDSNTYEYTVYVWWAVKVQITLLMIHTYLISSRHETQDKVFGEDYQYRMHNFFGIFFLQITFCSKYEENIARGTTDPGYRVYNLSYLSS